MSKGYAGSNPVSATKKKKLTLGAYYVEVVSIRKPSLMKGGSLWDSVR